MRFLKHSALVVLLGGGLIGTANATTFTFTGSGVSPGGSTTIFDSNIFAGGKGVNAGQINLTGGTSNPTGQIPTSNPGGSLSAGLLSVFCVDIGHTLTTSATWSVSNPLNDSNLLGNFPSNTSDSKVADLSNLIYDYYKFANNQSVGGHSRPDSGNNLAEATQLAIWSVEYGSAFSASINSTISNDVAALLTDAEGSTAASSNGWFLNELVPSSPATNQNLIYLSTSAPPPPNNGPNGVPEPASLLVLASGLLFAGMYGVRRSRSNTL